MIQYPFFMMKNRWLLLLLGLALSAPISGQGCDEGDKISAYGMSAVSLIFAMQERNRNAAMLGYIASAGFFVQGLMLHYMAQNCDSIN